MIIFHLDPKSAFYGAPFTNENPLFNLLIGFAYGDHMEANKERELKTMIGQLNEKLAFILLDDAPTDDVFLALFSPVVKDISQFVEENEGASPADAAAKLGTDAELFLARANQFSKNLRVVTEVLDVSSSTPTFPTDDNGGTEVALFFRYENASKLLALKYGLKFGE